MGFAQKRDIMKVRETISIEAYQPLKEYPETLYKYRTFNKWYEEPFEEGLIYFSSPDDFNDPFDCRIPIQYNVLTNKQVFEHFKVFVKGKYPALTRRGRMAKVKELKSQKNYKDTQLQAKIQKEIRSSSFGIFSLTNDNENILMWSYYANKHKGFCIGYDVKKIMECDPDWVYKGMTGYLDLYKVVYSENMPTITMTGFPAQEKMIIPLATKSKVWKHEQEYRILGHGGPRENLSIPNGVIREVILGCQIEDKDRNELLDLLRNMNPKPKVYVAELMVYQYSLKFKKIKY